MQERVIEARRQTGVVGPPTMDLSLDCEKGIMRVLAENGIKSSDVPIELLREWTLVAVQRRDCGLLGRAMTLAAASNHPMDRFVTPPHIYNR